MIGKEIILNYLKDKNNEDDVITFLKGQKRTLSKKGYSLDKESISLIIKLIKKSSRKVKYHAILLISNIEFCMEAKNFHDMCKIAADNSKDKDGNIRQACFLLIKKLNASMMAMPFIHIMEGASETEVNLIYESFRNLFYRLVILYKVKEDNSRKSILRSLDIMLPKIYDMAKFYNDKKEMELVNEMKEEIKVNKK